MSTPAEFLLARIAETASVAGEFRVHDISRCPAVWHGRLGQLDREWADCSCRWSDRLLADCEAKRQIVDLHGGDHVCWQPDYPVDGDFAETNTSGDCATMRYHAAVYADHADYREEWRP